MAEKERPEADFITKASVMYTDKFLLRAKIQLLPCFGGALDTLLSGLGTEYQSKRIEHFLLELDRRLKHIEKLHEIEPTEPLFDLMMQVFSEVIKTRSEEKRKRFANIVANQIMDNRVWDDAETATRLLADLTDIHIQIMEVALKAKLCENLWDGKRILTIYDHWELLKKKEAGEIPTNLSEHFPFLTNSVTEMICLELMARGLLCDEGVGGFGGGKFMGYFAATDTAQWLMDWICEPKN